MTRHLPTGLRGRLAAALTLTSLAGCALHAEPASPTKPAIHAAYVLLAETLAGGTAAFARVIVDPAQACPTLVGAGTERIGTTPRRNPHGFSIQVCEARYPFGRSLTVDGGPRLPVAVEAPSP